MADCECPGHQDIVYFNALVTGPSAGADDLNAIEATYAVTRVRPIVERPSNYYLSVVRLSIDLNSCPIMICPIMDVPPPPPVPPQDPQPYDPETVTPWVVGVSYGGQWYYRHLELQTSLFFNDEHWVLKWRTFIFNLDTLQSMINVAMGRAYAAFSAANPGAPQAIAGVAPEVLYDPITHLWKWVWHESWATLPPAVEPLTAGQARIGLNNKFLSIFDGFRNTLLTGTPAIEDAHIVFERTPINELTFPTPSVLRVTSQTYDCSALLNSVRRVVVTSTSLPISPENVANATGTATATALAAVVTDFVPQASVSGDQRSTVYYTPSAEYRLINMNSDLPLYHIDLAFHWIASDGRSYPIVLARNAVAEVKLAFINKSLYSNRAVEDAIKAL